METNRFCLSSPKIVSITSNPSVDRYEILLRILDENGDIVAPNEFIPAAERYGSIAQIDCWVIDFFSTYHNLSGKNFMSQGVYTINILAIALVTMGS